MLVRTKAHACSTGQQLHAYLEVLLKQCSYLSLTLSHSLLLICQTSALSHKCKCIPHLFEKSTRSLLCSPLRLLMTPHPILRAQGVTAMMRALQHPQPRQAKKPRSGTHTDVELMERHGSLVMRLGPGPPGQSHPGTLQ